MIKVAEIKRAHLAAVDEAIARNLVFWPVSTRESPPGRLPWVTEVVASGRVVARIETRALEDGWGLTFVTHTEKPGKRGAGV